MAKWKKKLRKFAKKAIPAIGLGLAATALAKNRNRAASIADNEAREFGFGQMNLKDYGPYKIGGYHRPKRKTYLQKGTEVGTAIPHIMAGESEFLAKGGRVKGGGKAKRGFGRAFTKSKK